MPIPYIISGILRVFVTFCLVGLLFIWRTNDASSRVIWEIGTYVIVAALLAMIADLIIDLVELICYRHPVEELDDHTADSTSSH